MRRRDILHAAFGVGLAATALPGQDVIQLRVPAPEDPGVPHTMMYAGTPVGDKARLSTFEFVRSEIGSTEVVRNAPYTADASTETVQLLADGNRIVHKDSTVLARDGEGRTRRDVTLPILGFPPGGQAAAEPPRFSFVFDPVTNTSWTLEHNTRTARKAQGQAVMMHTGGKIGGALPATTPLPAAGTHEIRIERAFHAEGAGMRVNGRNNEGKSESLGRQTIEGVVADGTRTNMVIPAGEIGNERPIEIVSERWYSPELQMVVMSRHSDPRTGETTYKLTNIRKGEPPKSLLDIPADYLVKSPEDQIRFMRAPVRDE